MIVQGSVLVHLVNGEKLIVHQDEITPRDSREPHELAAEIWSEIQARGTTLLMAGGPHPAVMKFTPSAVVAVSVTASPENRSE